MLPLVFTHMKFLGKINVRYPSNDFSTSKLTENPKIYVLELLEIIQATVTFSNLCHIIVNNG